MKSERNKKIELSDNQLAPSLAKPQDFEVMHPDKAATKPLPGHGQCGDTEREYNALLKEREQGQRKDKQTNQEVANQRVLARESFPSTDGKRK